MKAERVSRYVEGLKDDPRLRGESWEWYEDWLEGKAPSTQEGYLRVFVGFLEYVGMDTEQLYNEYKELVADPDPRKKKRMGKMVVDYQKHLMETEDLKGGSVQIVYRAVRGFFQSNELDLSLNGERVKDDSDEIPNISREQIEKLLEATGSYKTKAFMLFGRDSGLRVSDITNLPIRVIRGVLNNPELDYHTFEWTQKKTGRKCNPVIGPRCIKALRNWMDYRVNKLGLTTNDDEPIFCIERTRNGYTTKKGREVKGTTKGDWMDESNYSVIFGQLVRKARLKPLPGEKKKPSIHSLRKYHKTSLEFGGVPTSWINKMQGRKGEGTGGRYTKPNPQELIEIYSMGYPKLDGETIHEVEAKLEDLSIENRRLRLEIENLKRRAEVSDLLTDIIDTPEKLEKFKKLILET